MQMAGYMDFGENISDITGFYQDGREFAVVGLYNESAAFVDITDPKNLVEVGRIIGSTNTWRDIKYWDRHIYIGTEADDGVQVVSVNDLDHPVLVNTITDFGSSHNIHIDANGYLYVVGADVNDIWIYDLSYPAMPDLVGSWNGEYLHDIEVHNNKIYGAAIHSGNFYIIDVNDKTNPTTILSHDTGLEGISTHDCAVTYDEHYLITADETFGGHIKIWDISDYDNINLVSEYMTYSGHSVHNVYIRPGTNLVIMSYYVDGTRVIDIENPLNPIEVGYFDSTDLTGLYDGHWGTYAYLPSGHIISSDRQNGLFIFTSPLTDSSMEWGNCNGITGDNLTCYGDTYQFEYEILEEIINLNPELEGVEIEDIATFVVGKVKEIDLSERGLDSLIFPSDIGNLANLDLLILAENNLTNLPNEICDLPEDCNIDVTKNNLCDEAIQQFEACISNLGYQYCDDCESGFLLDGYCNNAADVDVLWNLIAINDTLSETNPMELGTTIAGKSNWNEGNLEYLDLSDQGIITLPENIGELNNLAELNLKNNSISVLPGSSTNMESLLVLKIHNNLLTELPITIGNLLSLEDLYLSGNQLTSIPESIGELQNLKKLFISDNQLVSLPSTICNLSEECNIQIEDNCLSASVENSLNCISNLGNQDACVPLQIVNFSPEKFQLFDPYPNPLNPTTTISFYLPNSSYITIKIMDITGRIMQTIKNEYMLNGNHSIHWNASDYSSGVYLVKMSFGNPYPQFVISQKVVLLK